MRSTPEKLLFDPAQDRTIRQRELSIVGVDSSQRRTGAAELIRFFARWVFRTRGSRLVHCDLRSNLGALLAVAYSLRADSAARTKIERAHAETSRRKCAAAFSINPRSSGVTRIRNDSVLGSFRFFAGFFIWTSVGLLWDNSPTK